MFDRQQLMRQISEVCFVIDDLTLYLDTHPLDTEALDAVGQAMSQRKELLCAYAKEFGPLTVNCIHVGQEPDRKGQENGPDARPGGQSSQNGQPYNLSGQYTKYAGKRHWTWTDGPLPWEGGCCNVEL